MNGATVYINKDHTEIQTCGVIQVKTRQETREAYIINCMMFGNQIRLDKSSTNNDSNNCLAVIEVMAYTTSLGE